CSGSDVECEGRSRRTDRARRLLGLQDGGAYSECRGNCPGGCQAMKVVLFCGGLGTRIREYSEGIPKPMIPIGHQPILWHVMQYYSQYGHRDFILCLGYKANVVKDYFLNYKQAVNTDCKISNFGKKVELLGERPPDWRISLVDTGIWRNIGQRLMAVRHHVQDEE